MGDPFPSIASLLKSAFERWLYPVLGFRDKKQRSVRGIEVLQLDVGCMIDEEVAQIKHLR